MKQRAAKGPFALFVLCGLEPLAGAGEAAATATQPLLLRTALLATSRSEDEEVPSSSAPLARTYGGYELREADLRPGYATGKGEAQAPPLSKCRYRPAKKDTMCHAHFYV